MFKKVQLKFFGIITAILIAIFIVVLSLVNIIMDVLMERQTNVVLRQVAAGVEYNDKTSTFIFNNPGRKEGMPRKEKIPPTSAAENVTSAATEPTSENRPRNTEKTTAAPIENDTPAQTYPQEETTIAQTEPPKQTTLPRKTRPQEQRRTEPVRPTEPPPETRPPREDQGGGGNWGEWQPPEDQDPDPWRDPWHDRDEWDKEEDNKDNDSDERPMWGNGGFMPTADNAFVPVLDGYTIVVNSPAPEEEVPPQPPNGGMGREPFGEPVPKSLGSIEFFVIMADKNGKYAAALNNDELTEETAQDYLDKIINDKDSEGMTGNLSFCAEKKENGTLVVLTDRTAEMGIMRKLKRTTVIVGLVSLIFLSVAAYFLSGLIVRPLKVTFEKQKQFISDASHELKTPLTVISTNADVLSGEIGDNKWLNYIRDQADRMNVLVNDLLSLTRLENNTREFITCEFDLSRAVTNAALPFECQAFESRKNFVLNVDDGIKIVGSEQHIKQMTGIFIDNALKYSKDGGTVRVSLTKEDGKAVLAVYNTGSGVREEEVDKLFERFYRSDESRNRSTGGYGLGLAIAKSIIDKHKFKVQVENQEGRSICFVVTM
ncbi:MAG: GHKL domain-containing protein [Ruminococcus sp.]|nr:GHKL domain-containing protein [Ruminococcus sp.]